MTVPYVHDSSLTLPIVIHKAAPHKELEIVMSETSPLLAGSSKGPPPAYSFQATDEYRVAHTSRIRAYTRRLRLDSPSPVSDNAASPILFSSKVALRRTVLVLAILLVFMFTSTVLLAVDRFRDIPNSEARAHIRREWHREELAHDKQHRWWDIERDQWEQDRRRWEIEKARHEAEDRRWEKERLRRMRLYWGPLWRNDHCHSYGTREYTARLWNIAPGVDGLAVCMQMPMTINNMSVLPSECEDRGLHGIHGRWLVDYGEVTCQPYWATLNDKGCIDHRLGLHRFEARLQNVHSGDDWHVMCDTAPNVINGIEFKYPTSCENRGWFSGMVGIWEVPDTNCKD